MSEAAVQRINEIAAVPQGDAGAVRSMQSILENAFVSTRSTSVTHIARLLRETLENIVQGVIMFDAEHRAVVWNQRALALLDLPQAMMEKHPSLDYIIQYQLQNGEFRANQMPIVNELRIADRVKATTTVERSRPNGTILKITTVPLSFGGFVRTFTDVTEARQRQAQQLAAEKEFRQLYENAAIGIYRTTIDGRIVRSNRALVTLNGFQTEAELINSVVNDAGEWYVQPNRLQEFQETVLRDGFVVEFESEVILSNTGQRIWISENAWLVRDEFGNPAFFEGTILDITARKKSEAQLEHLATHDSLTSLDNRAASFKKLTEMLQDTFKYPHIHVLTIDLDAFKEVNDAHGHEAGDHLLVSVANRLRALSPQDAAIARLGGDEFVLLCSSLQSDTAVATFASRLIKGLSVPYRIFGKMISIGVSIGISASSDGETALDLMRASDAALYEAKAGGKLTYRFFANSLGPNVLKARAMDTDFRKAIFDRKLHVAYQPIVRVSDGRVVSREALVRWSDPQHGNIPPATFLPIAERLGMMRALERFVIEESCALAARDPLKLPVAINVSPTEISSGHFYELLSESLVQANCDPAQIEIEITEGVILSEDRETMLTLERIRDLGVRIALDDFGAGYSSLVYLQRFRFDKIKIDQYFLRNAREDGVDKAILKSVLGLGKDIGTDIVVEGVETEKERDLLFSLGCDYAQGYYFGRPAPIAH